LKSFCVLQDHYDDKRNKTVFHNTTPDLQDQDQDQVGTDYKYSDLLTCLLTYQDLLVSDRSCLKTDGLRPHHWCHVIYMNNRSCLIARPVSAR